MSESVWNVRGLRAMSKDWSSPRGPHTITTPPPQCHRIRDIGYWRVDRHILSIHENCTVQVVYRIAGNFQGTKYSWFSNIETFRG